jgi:hypothetical protein
MGTYPNTVCSIPRFSLINPKYLKNILLYDICILKIEYCLKKENIFFFKYDRINVCLFSSCLIISFSMAVELSQFLA